MSEEGKEKITELNFSEVVKGIESKLSKSENITLATSLHDRVTARTVQYISEGLDVYFTSFGFNKKIQQIKSNNRVALNLHDVQFEGEAEVFNFPLDEDMKKIESKFIEKISWYTPLSQDNEFVLVRIKPKKIVQFTSINNIFYLRKIDFETKKAYKIKLSDKDNPNYPY